MKKITLLAGFALVVCGLGNLQASSFNNSSGLTGVGISPSNIYSFDNAGLAQNAQITDQFAGISFSAPIFYDGNSASSAGCSGFNDISGDCISNFQSTQSAGLITSNPAPFSILFNSLETYAAFAIVTDNNGANNTTVQAIRNGAVVDSIVFTTGSFTPQNPTTANYVGFYNDDFDTIRVVTSGRNLVMIDNLQISSVPEPGTLGMLTLGLGGVIAIARRRTA